MDYFETVMKKKYQKQIICFEESSVLRDETFKSPLTVTGEN